MRIYEELFIIRPDATEEEIDALVEQTRQVITGGGGSVDKVDKWGLRRLAYRVHKRDDGYYVLVQFNASAEVVKEIERRFRVSDLVLKYLTVRIDEKLKRLEKRKREREKRARKRPAAAAPPPASVPGRPTVEQQMMATPGEPVPET
jgi:small subunit ribosomal protein S6